MNIEFKAWDKKNKKMIHPHGIPVQPGDCCFSIDLNGIFSVKERSRLSVNMFPAMDFIERDNRDFELFNWIGLTSKDNKKIFPGDVILDKSGNRMTVRYGDYKGPECSWGIKPTNVGCYIEFSDGGTYALSQNGGGYSIAAGECDHLGHSYEQ